MTHGLMYFLPIYITTLVAGGIWEVFFATVRGHEVNEGFLVTSMLFVLTLPASIPLVAGGLGHFVWCCAGQRSVWRHRQKLSQSSPDRAGFFVLCLSGLHVGRSIWTPVDGFSGATRWDFRLRGCSGARGKGLRGGMPFLDNMQGSLGNLNLACLIGLAFLLATKIANYRHDRRLSGGNGRIFAAAELDRI